MKHWFASLRHVLETLDRKPLPALALRAAITLLVMAPWDLRFTPQPFGPEDLDPRILARARELGIDLMDPGQWPHLSGLLARIALVALLAALSWWLLSRLRIWTRRRLGSGAALMVVLVGTWAFLFQIALAGSRLLLVDSAFDKVAVWGGWVRTYLFHPNQTIVAVVAMALLVGLTELLLLLWSEQRRLDQAERLALSARMAPHFLFNALNTLRARIEQDPDGALSLTDRLSRVLRRLFHATAEATATLQQELELVEDYLGLEKARLGERLAVRLDIPEALLEDRLPVLGLQVLVENAVKHGVASLEQGGEVVVEARREGRYLILAVTDPGQGLGEGQGLGAALDNLRLRLARPGDLRLERAGQTHTATLRYRQGEVLA